MLLALDIHADYGFLSQNPATQLPADFAPIMEIIRDLPYLILFNASALREEIKRLPLLSIDDLYPQEVRLASLFYDMLKNAYVHKENGVSLVPKNIAVPAVRLAEKLNVDIFSKPPVLGYNSYVLDNCKKKQNTAPFYAENLEPIATFTGTKSEKSFIIAHAIIEKRAAPGIQAVCDLRQATREKKSTAASHLLSQLANSMRDMREVFYFLTNTVSPELYRRNIRPWLMSFTNVVYEGIWEYEKRPSSFRGASGAQSPTIPAFDAALEIRYENRDIRESLADMKKYLHPRHQMFLCSLAEEYGLRKFAQEKPALKDAYNDVIDALVEFRTAHAKFIASYVAPQGSDPRGTGSAPIPWWLNAIIEETRAHYL